MNGILLTQDSTFLIGQIAWVLGKIMEGIFTVIDFIGIPNIGLAIILFTIIVNLLMMPLTIKQQKFSKLSAKMQPEIQAIQAKYKNKKDSESQMAMTQETQAVYAKYGVSPTGSCLYLLIQMPILFSLYRVIYAMPAYVTKIGNTFRVLADKIMSVDNAAFLKESGIDSISNVVAMYGKNITDTSEKSVNSVIDVLNKLSTTDMAAIAEHYDLSSLTYPIENGQLILSNDTTRGLIDTYNNFLGLNMGNSPQHIISQAIESGAWLLVIGAILIPVLSAVTQWINVKLMPQQNTDNQNEQAASMASSMKVMNMVMPLISAWFCFSLPSGMGLYWVAGSIVRSIQQVIVNKHIDTTNLRVIIMSTEEREKAMKKASEYYNTGNEKPGSMMAKANMVKKYNEKNNKDNN